MSKPGTRVRTALRVALAMILILLVGWTSLRGVIHARDQVAPVEVTAAGVQVTAQSGGEAPSTDSSTDEALPHIPGVVLIKLRPGVAVATGGTRVEADGEHATLTTDAVLDDLLADLQVIAITPVFRRTDPPAPLGRGAPNGAPDGAPEGVLNGALTPAPDLTRWVKVTLPADADVSAAVDELSAKPAVAWAEPDYLYEFDTTPDDTYFGQQWHLHNTGQYHLADADIDAPEAWDTTTGLSTTIIAVIDTGIDRDHVDLDAQIWSNPGETPDNGVDDDNNGYVDDTWGWNWVSDLSDPDDYDYDDPRDDNGHGTHVAGIAAAETNNGSGVAGVCWHCKVMSLKAFEHNGVGTTSDIVQAIDYATDKGADIINMSFGSYAESLLLEDTLAVAYGDALLVAAAGNGRGGRGVSLPFYPAAIPFVIGVGASDVGCVERDPITAACTLIAEHKARFSNYGVNADVCAPGVSIYSTYPGGYSSMAGTSMSAPLVAGIGALIMAENTTWSHELVRGQMIHTPDGLYVGGEFVPCGSGRVNADSALAELPVPDLLLRADSITYLDSGDGDGIPDAGETVTMTMLLENLWGEATDVTGELSTTDAYITITDGAGNWGDISAYATNRNATEPFVLSLHPGAPNNHEVTFTLVVTAGGGYSTHADLSFLVQRGVEIPSTHFPAIITESMTLSDEYLYIVRQNMLVPEGMTLTIEPGVRLQFDLYKFVRIQGTLIASGTEDAEITLTSNQPEPQPGDYVGLIFDNQSSDVELSSARITRTIAMEGMVLPGIGVIDSITGTPIVDMAGDIYFTSSISGTGGGLSILRWLNGPGKIELTGGPMPEGWPSVVFGDVYLASIAGVMHVVYDRPSDTYESGCIINHVVMEYGGSLEFDRSSCYIANSVFRYNGTLPAVIYAYDDMTGPDRPFVIRDTVIRDNLAWAVYTFMDRAYFRILSSTIRSNHGGISNIRGKLRLEDSILEYNDDSAVVCGSGTGSTGRALIRYNTISHNRNTVGAGLLMKKFDCVARFNTLSGNLSTKAIPPDTGTNSGGSAAYLSVTGRFEYNTVVGNVADPGDGNPLGATIFGFSAYGYAVRHNSILANRASYDVYLAPGPALDLDATHNYWGTTDLNEIRYNRTFDYWNDFEPGEAYIEPVLTRPEPLAPGFLWHATIEPEPPVGQETMTVTLEFSKPMTTTVQPMVTFGVVEPFTQHGIDNGDWISSTHWVGSYDVNVATGDGINTLRVADAEDSGGMVIPVDTRFEFNIQVAGTSSFELEGVAGLGFARLTYPESDLEDLAGYVIYRSVGDNSDYRPLETTLSTVYTDTAVINGQTYWYLYRLLNTDFEEVAESNEIALTPDDFTVPTTPVVTDDGATTNMFTQLHATWSSDDPETGVVEYQYCIGASVGGCEVVTWTSRGTTTEVTKTGLLLVDGQAYYINVKARNGRGSWSAVGSSDGITVEILPAPTVTWVTPISGVRTESHLLTVTGTGFESGPTVRLGTAVLGNVTVVSAKELRARVGANQVPAGVYDLSVANFDGQSGTLSDAYTVTNPPPPAPAPVTVNPEALYIDAGTSSFTVDIDISGVADLGGFQFDLVFDATDARVTAVGIGPFLGSTGRTVNVLGPMIDNTAGVVTFGGWSFGSPGGPSGSGRLAMITFEPLDEGRVDLSLENVSLTDSINVGIPPELHDDLVHLVTFPFGDFDEDCFVTAGDIMVVASLWNSFVGDGTYDPDYDFDADGDIDVIDIMTVVAVWNEACVLEEGLEMLIAPSGAVLLSGAPPADAAPADAGCLASARTMSIASLEEATTGVRFRFDPSEASAPVGGDVDLELWADDVANFGGYQVTLTYEPTVLEFISVTAGSALASTGNTTIDLGPAVSATTGEATLGTISYGAAAGPDGSGHVATVRLRMITATPAAVDLRRLIAVNMDAVPLTVAGSEKAIINILTGDCNGDLNRDAGDLSALILEIFDGDGAVPADVPGSTFRGWVGGCNANEDLGVDAGDISCLILLIFGGSCG